MKKLCSRLLSTKVEFYWQKQQNRVFVPPFGGLRGNVHGSSMAGWKARDRLPIRANWNFFVSSHGWGAISGYWSKWLCSKGGWVMLSANFRRKWSSTNDCWRQKTRVPGLSRGVVCVIVRLDVLTLYITGLWQKDRLTDGHTTTANTRA